MRPFGGWNALNISAKGAKLATLQTSADIYFHLLVPTITTRTLTPTCACMQATR